MDTETNKKKSNFFTFFTIISVIIFIISILSSFYFYYIKKDFDFIVEFQCDPTKEECFIRDCSSPDSCPPNNLLEFKRYIINGNDFKKCEKQNCLESCLNGSILCEQISCEINEEMGESCIFSQVKEILE